MKEKINEDHVKICYTLEVNKQIQEIPGIIYSKFIGHILYPKNSVNANKYYLVSIQNSSENIPINILSEKSNIHDAFKLFFQYIKDKSCKENIKINYTYDTLFNVIIYRDPNNISIKQYTLDDVLNPKIKYAYFDWGNTLCSPGKSKEFAETGDKMYIDPEAENTLQKMKAAGINLGIISNNETMKKDSFMELLKKSYLNKYFKDIILSSDGYPQKPNQDMFNEGIKRSGVPPKYILYVGNNYLKDIVPAANIGLQTAYKMNTPSLTFKTRGIANYNINKLNELLDKLNIN